MARSQRLLDLLSLLRSHYYAVTAESLANKLQVTVRTVYRDIEVLRQQGVNIQGEAGVGYTLAEDNFLPPLMLTVEEVEALVVGARWVARYSDEQLSERADSALAKITGVLSPHQKQSVENNTLFVRGYSSCNEASFNLTDASIAPTIREAIRAEQKLSIEYLDGEKRRSNRVIYPFALGFFGELQMLAAWCELRDDYRHFRLDRIASCQVLPETYIPRKQRLVNDWMKQTGISSMSGKPTDKN